jgi:hypothetical protein
MLRNYADNGDGACAVLVIGLVLGGIFVIMWFFG